jgi:hypothetical protein
MKTFDLTRPILTLKKKPAPEPVVETAQQRRRRTRAAIRFLAGLGLPLFQRCDREDTVALMAVGIREEVLARIEPAHHHRACKSLKTIVLSLRYKTALKAEGARRRTLDDADAGPAFAQ